MGKLCLKKIEFCGSVLTVFEIDICEWEIPIIDEIISTLFLIYLDAIIIQFFSPNLCFDLRFIYSIYLLYHWGNICHHEAKCWTKYFQVNCHYLTHDEWKLEITIQMNWYALIATKFKFLLVAVSKRVCRKSGRWSTSNLSLFGFDICIVLRGTADNISDTLHDNE